MNNMINEYVMKIKRCFPIHGREEKEYIRKLKQQIGEYEAGVAECTYDKLIAEFGSPLSVASEYFMNVDSDYLIKKLRRGKVVKRSIAVILTIAITIWGILSVWLCYDAYRSINSRIAYTEIYIEDLGNQ